jgi:hypothetical protein
MKFTLEVRMVKEADLKSSVPFMPEEDEYELYLDALREELSCVAAVSEVMRTGSRFNLVTTRPMPVGELKVLIRPAFTGSLTMNLRYLSLDEA